MGGGGEAGLRIGVGHAPGHVHPGIAALIQIGHVPAVPFEKDVTVIPPASTWVPSTQAPAWLVQRAFESVQIQDFFLLGRTEERLTGRSGLAELGSSWLTAAGGGGGGGGRVSSCTRATLARAAKARRESCDQFPWRSPHLSCCAWRAEGPLLWLRCLA